MSDLISVVSTVSYQKQSSSSDLKTNNSTHHEHHQQAHFKATDSVEAALLVLRSEPTEQQALDALARITDVKTASFDPHIPNSHTTRILRTLISTTVADFWIPSFAVRERLKQCLRSVSGIQGLLSVLRRRPDQPTREAPTAVTKSGTSGASVYISVLEDLLGDVSLPWLVWQGIQHATSAGQAHLLWKDFMTTVASGRPTSIVAQWIDEHQSGSKAAAASWIANGLEYAQHVTKAISDMAMQLPVDDHAAWPDAGAFLSKCLNLGYSHGVAATILEGPASMPISALQKVTKLVSTLRRSEQAKMLELLLLALERRLGTSAVTPLQDQASILIATLLQGDDALHSELTSLFSDPSRSMSLSLACRRAAYACLGTVPEVLQTLYSSNIKIFGEVLFIKHAPTSQQEVCAENILLAAAHSKKYGATLLQELVRSSAHMNAISNRLNASSQRARALGMCVGMAMSGLVDQGSTRLNFDVDELKEPWAKTLMGLVEVEDAPASIDMWMGTKRLNTMRSQAVNPYADPGPTPRHTQTQHQAPTIGTGPRIVEILNEEEDDDLMKYPKPDSDPEDSDDDPTLINRDKVKAPVYIRDLMAGIIDSENHDRHKLALEHASSLIRRKAQHGKEVRDHATELGLSLIGLQDHFEIDNFIELRLQALIALLLSDPTQLGPWYAEQAFDGDYSLSQRGTILTAIGLSARELAGYSDVDALNPTLGPKDGFPSKRLPDKYHARYSSAVGQNPKSLPTTPLHRITSSLADAILAPMAAEAADREAGPNILKVRTFSSRLDTTKSEQRTKRIPNQLAKHLSDSFFTPLLGRFYTATSSSYSRLALTDLSLSSSSPSTERKTGSANIFLTPHLLTTFIRTLAILLHASGPATQSLPALTADFWALLLSLRSAASADKTVMEAVLFALLALVEVNCAGAGDGGDGARRLAADHGRELVETREWVAMVWERLPGGKSRVETRLKLGTEGAGGGGGGGGGMEARVDEEEERLRGLAAAVLVRLGEVVERWQRLMVGDLMEY